jgi:hypothetical protein
MTNEAIQKIESLLEEAKIADPKLAQAIKDNYHNNTLANVGSSSIGSILTGGVSVPVAGMYQGMQNSHPIAGLLNGSAGTLGAASNNIEGITLADAFNKGNVAGNLGVFSPVVTPLQYGFGKLFGDRSVTKEQYQEALKKFS